MVTGGRCCHLQAVCKHPKTWATQGTWRPGTTASNSTGRRNPVIEVIQAYFVFLRTWHRSSCSCRCNDTGSLGFPFEC